MNDHKKTFTLPVDSGTQLEMTDNADEYNGWTNRSTWNVSLWLNNEEPLYQAFMVILDEHPDDQAAAAAIKQYCRFIWGDKTPDHDALDAANFVEIARNNRFE